MASSQDLLNYARAIASIESGGNVSALGPVTKSGDRAYGKYQVMGNNIPEWTKMATGTSMSPQDFLKNEGAQDQVFNHYFGSALNTHGNPQDAASVWFTGQPMATGAKHSDGYNTGAQYVQKFTDALNNQNPQAPQDPASTTALADATDDAALPPNARPTMQDGQPQGPSFMDKLTGPGGIGNTLQEAGAWLQSANNPAGAASLLASIRASKKDSQGQLVDMGADPLTGKKRFGIYNAATGAFKAIGATSSGAPDVSGASGTGGAGPGEMDSDAFYAGLQKVQAGQMSPEAFKKQLHPLVADYAQALVDGTADPRMLGNRAAALRPYAIAAAHALDPTFNENQIAARQTEAKSLATSNNPSTLGGALASLGKVSLHGQELIQASKDLADLQVQGGQYTGANWIENRFKKAGGDTDYKGKLNALNAAADLYAREADRLTSGGHPTLSGQQGLRELFSSDMSHEERLAAVKKVLGMAQEATDQLVYNNNNAFGRIGTPKEKAVEDFMSPATLKAWKAVQASTGTAGAAKPKLPPGVTSIEVIP